MPIEFDCSQCQNRLRTPDDAGGKQSRCPQCGHIQTIPAQSSPTVTGSAGLASQAFPSAGQAATDPAGQGRTANPFADTGSPATNPYAAPVSVSAGPVNPHGTVLPGALLISLTVLCIIFLGLAIFAGIVSVIDDGMASDDATAFAFLGVTMAMQVLILWGAVNLVRRRGYTMALVGTLASIVPLSVCWCLHLPIGIWALIALTRPGMRAAFEDNLR